MANVDGKSVSIAEAKGAKGTLVVFTCNSCPYAQAWQSRIAELGNTYAKQGIGVIAINAQRPGVNPADDMPSMQARAKMLSLEFPYVMDATSDVARAFGATAHARGVPVRRQGQAGLPRRDRRQRPRAGQGECALPERRAGGDRGRQGGGGLGDQVDRLRHQVPREEQRLVGSSVAPDAKRAPPDVSGGACGVRRASQRVRIERARRPSLRPPRDARSRCRSGAPRRDRRARPTRLVCGPAPASP